MNKIPCTCPCSGPNWTPEPMTNPQPSTCLPHVQPHLLIVYLGNQVPIVGGGEVELQALSEFDIVEEVTKLLQRSCVAALQQARLSCTCMQPRRRCYALQAVSCVFLFSMLPSTACHSANMQQCCLQHIMIDDAGNLSSTHECFCM